MSEISKFACGWLGLFGVVCMCLGPFVLIYAISLVWRYAKGLFGILRASLWKGSVGSGGVGHTHAIFQPTSASAHAHPQRTVVLGCCVVLRMLALCLQAVCFPFTRLRRTLGDPPRRITHFPNHHPDHNHQNHHHQNHDHGANCVVGSNKTFAHIDRWLIVLG